jgi:hypothetical protein
MPLRPDEHAPARPRAWARLLLIIPFITMLWVPFYNSAEPRLGGIPYFYWYQFAWIGVGALVNAIVYFVDREPEPR